MSYETRERTTKRSHSFLDSHGQVSTVSGANPVSGMLLDVLGDDGTAMAWQWHDDGMTMA